MKFIRIIKIKYTQMKCFQYDLSKNCLSALQIAIIYLYISKTFNYNASAMQEKSKMFSLIYNYYFSLFQRGKK